jgi:hypothetical protein
MPVHSTGVRILLLAAIASAAFVSNARAQEGNTLAVGVNYTARAADAGGTHGSRGVGFAWRFGDGGTGWGWSVGMGWFSADIDRSVAGRSIEFGEMHVRPLMAGYGYTYSFGRTSVSAQLVAGYAFVSFSPTTAAVEAYREKLGAPDVTVKASNTFAVRPQTSVWVNLSRRVGVNLTAGYVVARPELTIRSSVGEQSLRHRADVVVLSTGLVYKIF